MVFAGESGSRGRKVAGLFSYNNRVAKLRQELTRAMRGWGADSDDDDDKMELKGPGAISETSYQRPNFKGIEGSFIPAQPWNLPVVMG